jgi:hypothetical protein
LDCTAPNWRGIIAFCQEDLDRPLPRPGLPAAPGPRRNVGNRLAEGPPVAAEILRRVLALSKGMRFGRGQDAGTEPPRLLKVPVHVPDMNRIGMGDLIGSGRPKLSRVLPTGRLSHARARQEDRTFADRELGPCWFALRAVPQALQEPKAPQSQPMASPTFAYTRTGTTAPGGADRFTGMMET